MSRTEYLRAMKPWAPSCLPWKITLAAISRLTLFGLSVLLLAGCNIIKPSKDAGTPVVQSGSSTDRPPEPPAEAKPAEKAQKTSPPVATTPAPRPEPVTETRAASASIVAAKQQPRKAPLVFTGDRPTVALAPNVLTEPPPVQAQTAPKQSLAEKPGSIV